MQNINPRRQQPKRKGKDINSTDEPDANTGVAATEKPNATDKTGRDKKEPIAAKTQPRPVMPSAVGNVSNKLPTARVGTLPHAPDNKVRFNSR